MMFLILNKLYNTLLVKSFIDSLRSQTPIFLKKVKSIPFFAFLDDLPSTFIRTQIVKYGDYNVRVIGPD